MTMYAEPAINAPKSAYTIPAGSVDALWYTEEKRKEGFATNTTPTREISVARISGSRQGSFSITTLNIDANIGDSMMSTLASPMGMCWTAKKGKIIPPNPSRERRNNSPRTVQSLPNIFGAFPNLRSGLIYMKYNDKMHWKKPRENTH